MNQKRAIIGIDASRAFSLFRTGTENYSYQIIKALVSIDCRYGFRLYTRQPVSGRYPEIFSQQNVAEKHILWPVMWTQGGLALETWLSSPRLLFIPAHVVPFAKNITVPTVVVVHDIRTEFLPHHSDWRQKIYLNPLIEKVRAGLATHIIAVSNSTKNDVVEELQVDPEKISVVYEGVDRERFSPTLSERTETIRKVRERYGLKKKNILFVGTVQPRKNLERLIEACSRLLIIQSGEFELIIAGKKGWLADNIYRSPSLCGISSHVKFLDYVEDKDLPYLYAQTQSFVFPSLYEGFGLPVLEALSVGVPVVTSSVSSLPEVGGDLVTYVDPLDVASIAHGIEQSLGTALNMDSVSKHLQKFTWEMAGQQTLSVFDKVCS